MRAQKRQLAGKTTLDHKSITSCERNGACYRRRAAPFAEITDRGPDPLAYLLTGARRNRKSDSNFAPKTFGGERKTLLRPLLFLSFSLPLSPKFSERTSKRWRTRGSPLRVVRVRAFVRPSVRPSARARPLRCDVRQRRGGGTNHYGVTFGRSAERKSSGGRKGKTSSTIIIHHLANAKKCSV